MVTLNDLLSEGSLAMTFHRGHWCPYCRINTKAFAEARERISRACSNGSKHTEVANSLRTV
jgi:hypothetical protein